MLNEWARKWGIPPAALEDLRNRMGAVNTDPPPVNHPPLSEAAVQANCRLQATRDGDRLWRNNVGATFTADGSFLRYGLMNDSKAMNMRIKSSDLVGIHRLTVTPEMVGRTVGQFMAVECKAEGWKYTGSGREVAQLRCLDLIVSLGGVGMFVSS